MITIVIGTNRKNSKSKKVAEYYQGLLNSHGAASEILDLAELPEDCLVSALYENSGKNEAFNRLREKMEHSSKYVFVVPEYNNSYPGALKVFIDGLSYPNAVLYKKCALVGISDGVQGNALGLSHLTDVFHYLGMHVLAQKVRIPVMKKNFADDHFQDPVIEKLLREQAKLLIDF